MPENKCPLCGASIEKSSTCPHCHHDVIPCDNVDIASSIVQRNSGVFNKATALLENLLRKNVILPEIYYQLLLCEYGIFFIDDKDDITSKYLFAKEHNESVYNKKNYQLLANYLASNPQYKEYYEKLIQELEGERHASLNKPQVDKFDAYICYKRGKEFRNDYETAKKLYDKLTEAGIKTCFNEYNSDLVAELEVIKNVRAFFLIGATPIAKDALLKPWIACEYGAFYQRLMTSADNYLRFYPIYNNGFTRQDLPELIRGVHEGYKFDYKFDDVFKNIIEDLIVKERKSNFKKIDLKPLNRTLNIPQVTLSKRTIYKFDDAPLSSLDNTDYSIAVADMNIGTKDKFESAYKTLNRISNANPHSLKVNLSKLKCSFGLKENESIEYASLKNVTNFYRLMDDFIHVMEINSVGNKDYLKSLQAIVYRDFEKDPSYFLSLIKSKDNIYDFCISLCDDNEKAYNFAYQFLSKIKQLIAYDGLKSLNFDDIKYFFNQHIEPVFFASGSIGATVLIEAYKDIINTLILRQKKEQLPFITYLLDEILLIEKYNPFALWKRFIVSLGCLFDENADQIAARLKKRNFIEIDINNPKIDEKKNKTNMYYVLLRMVQVGYKADFFDAENIFVILLAAVLRMINYSSKLKLAMSVSNLLMSLSLRENLEIRRLQALIVSIADRLLIEKEYKTAQLYYEEALLLGESHLARWGLVKCELKCPTNYGVIFADKPLNESQSFRNLITSLESNGKSSNEYMNYYTFLGEIKRDKHKKELVNAFYIKQQNLLNADFPMDDTPSSIMHTVRMREVEFKKEAFASRFNSDRKAFIKSNVIFGLIAMITIVVSMVIFKPEIAFAVALIFYLLFIIGKKANWKIVTNQAGTFAGSLSKALFFIFSLLSLFLPYILFTSFNGIGLDALMSNSIVWEPMRASAANIIRIAAISFVPIRVIHTLLETLDTKENTYYSEMPKFIVFNLMMPSLYLAMLTIVMNWVNYLPSEVSYNVSLIVLLILSIILLIANVLLLFFYGNINFALKIFGKKGARK